MKKITFLILLIFLSCQDKEKEAQIKQMELEIKAKELELQQKDLEYKERTYQDSLSRLETVEDENKPSVFFIVAGNEYAESSGSGFLLEKMV